MQGSGGQCDATTNAGVRCRGRVWNGGPWCSFHHPDLAEQRAAARIEGGKAKASRRRAQKELEQASLSTGELDGLLSLAMRRLVAGRLEPSVASALGSLARASLAVRDHQSIEDRIAALEQSMMKGRAS